MSSITVEVDVDVEDVLDSVADDELHRLGLRRYDERPAPSWDDMRLAIRRRDLAGILRLLEKLADADGVILDTSPLLRVAA